MPTEPDDYALVVGIDHYKPEELPPLSCARRDADEVERWLLEEGGGGLPQGNRKKIVSQPNSDKPVNSEIDDAIEEIFELVRQRPTPARRFYFYFSGHGMATGAIQAFLCLPKWSNSRRKMAIDSQDYWLMLAGTGLFTEIVCLFDCCRSYKPNVGGLGSTLGTARPDAQAANARLFMAFAAEFLQSAFEENGTEGHGYFTRALLSALRGGACRAAGGVPADRLKGFLESETPRLAERDGKKQIPVVSNGFPAATGPVFGSALPSDGTCANKLVYLVAISTDAGRRVVLVRPDETEVPWDRSQPWRIEAGQGLHILEDKSNGTILKLPRDVTQGEIHVTF
jgi:hypothetical protein